MASERKKVKGPCNTCCKRVRVFQDTLLCESCDSKHCRRCGEAGEEFAANGFCDDCDDQHYYCCICKSYEHEDDPCRHLFRNAHGEWIGSGAGHPHQTVMASFSALLALMPAGFAQALKDCLAKGNFHTWFVAPMIGGGGTLHLKGMPWDQAHSWGTMLIDLGSGDHAETVSDGYHWLASLYDGDTPDANRTTLYMINKRLAAAEVGG